MNKQQKLKSIEDARAWLTSIPESDDVAAAAFLGFLNSREAFSAETSVPNEEAHRFMAHVSGLVKQLTYVGLVVKGVVRMEFDKDAGEFTYGLTKKGHEAAANLK